MMTPHRLLPIDEALLIIDDNDTEEQIQRKLEATGIGIARVLKDLAARKTRTTILEYI
jgi:hypothetical protein